MTTTSLQVNDLLKATSEFVRFIMGEAPMRLTAGQKMKWINATYFTIHSLPPANPNSVTIQHFNEMPLLMIPALLAESMRIAYLESTADNK